MNEIAILALGVAIAAKYVLLALLAIRDCRNRR